MECGSSSEPTASHLPSQKESKDSNTLAMAGKEDVEASALRSGDKKKLVLLYETDDKQLRANDVNVRLVPTANGTKIVMDSVKYKHTSGAIPPDVFGVMTVSNREKVGNNVRVTLERANGEIPDNFVGNF